MRIKEKIMEVIMMCCSFVTILTTIAIIVVLLVDTIKFFSDVSIVDFLTDTQSAQPDNGHDDLILS